ncbi:hypothetical protein [Spirillospora sp. NBC_01491]|uniref:hypothetical protein n=1 Tax=Spirillospora sp. NBC_01491 TaxID=2976007 RepID=UPI002E2F5C95|nr:hypothetical protein [Spirillospora sp. NBC_01491]
MVTALRRLIHRLTGRHAWRVQEAETAAGRVYGPWLHCSVCGTTLVLQAEPPFEHPDSMTVELPEVDEEWLADLASRTWPSSARAEAIDVATAWTRLANGEAA